MPLCKYWRWVLYNFGIPANQIDCEWPLLSNNWKYWRIYRSRGSSVSIVPDYGLDDRAMGIRSPAEAKGFLLVSVSRPALGPTQPPVQWVPGVLSPGVKRCRGVTLTTHPHLVPRSRMSKSCTYSPLKRLHGVCGTALALNDFQSIRLSHASIETDHSGPYLDI
jgi:hypothetical protein